MSFLWFASVKNRILENGLSHIVFRLDAVSRIVILFLESSRPTLEGVPFAASSNRRY